MPVFLEPDQKFPVVLECDKGKDPTPTFYAKSQSMRGQLQICEVLDALTKNTNATAAELFAQTTQKLAEVIVGWSGMVKPDGTEVVFASESAKELLTDLLSYNEARELLRRVAHNMEYERPEEKKSSE